MASTKTTAKKTTKSATKGAAKRATKPAAKTATKNTAKSAPKKAAKTTVKAATKSTAKTTTKRTTKAAPKRAAKTTAKRATKAAPKSAAKTTTKRATTATAKRTTKTTAKRTTKAAPKRTTRASKRTLEPIIRLAIKSDNAKSNSQFGRGIADLCLGVREKGSLNAAAKDMGMAYSKAWRIVKDTESALGMKLLDRDGAHGSSLTKEGNKLLDAYLAIDKKLQKVAETEFAKLSK